MNTEIMINRVLKALQVDDEGLALDCVTCIWLGTTYSQWDSVLATLNDLNVVVIFSSSDTGTWPHSIHKDKRKLYNEYHVFFANDNYKSDKVVEAMNEKSAIHMVKRMIKLDRVYPCNCLVTGVSLTKTGVR